MKMMIRTIKQNLLSIALRNSLALLLTPALLAPAFAPANDELSEEEAALIAAALLAADSESSASSANAEHYVLDEILITARRKPENSDTVPVTVRAFDQENLRELSINTTLDLQQTVSGVFLGGSGSRSNTLYSIRGQGQPVIGQGSPGVVTYFADVPLPNGANAVPQYDVDNIQVLKGPQGTLFGRNTVGGAILTYPAAPTYNVEGYLQIAGTNYDGHFAQGALNLPIVDEKLAVRLAGQYQKRSGYTENLGNGNDQDDLDSKSARLSVLFQPTEAFKNLTVVDYHKTDTASSGAILDHASPVPIAANTFARFDILAVEQSVLGPRRVNLNTPNSLEASELFGVSNRTDIELEHVTITNILAYRTTEMHIFAQVDGIGDVPLETGAVGGPGTGTINRVPMNILEGTVDRELKQFSDELHVKGMLFDDKVEWLLGRFYLRSEPDGVIASATGVFAPTDQLYQFIENESNAIFANAAITLADPLKLNVGVRQTWDEYGICTGTGEMALANRPAPAAITNCALLTNPSALQGKSDAMTYTVGLDWQVSDDIFSYITHRQGYRSGGLNGPELGTGLAQLQEFKPEYIQDYEIGLRTNWHLGNASGKVHLAYFLSKSEDVQVSARGVSTSILQNSNPTLCDGTITETLFIDGDCDLTNDPAQTALTLNAGDVEVEGLDLLISTNLWDRLFIELTGTYQESKTTSYEVPTIVAPFVSANEIPVLYSPRKSATAKLQYIAIKDASIGELAINANYYYSDEFSVSADGFMLPSYDITNARIDLNSAFGSDFDIGFYVRNVFNKATPIGPGVSLPLYTLVYNEPRIWGIEARYHFGEQ